MLIGRSAADLPDANKSDIGCNVNLGGVNGSGVVDPLVEKVVTVRDPGNNLVPNSTVVIWFGACTSQDIRLSSTQSFPGMTINCPAKTVSAVTDMNGLAHFRIVGGAVNNGSNSSGHASACAEVRADNVVLGYLKVGAFDQNSVGGVSVADLSAFASDRFGSYRARSDFDCNGAVTVADLSGFAGVRFGGGSISSGAACP